MCFQNPVLLTDLLDLKDFFLVLFHLFGSLMNYLESSYLFEIVSCLYHLSHENPLLLINMIKMLNRCYFISWQGYSSPDTKTRKRYHLPTDGKRILSLLNFLCFAWKLFGGIVGFRILYRSYPAVLLLLILWGEFVGDTLNTFGLLVVEVLQIIKNFYNTNLCQWTESIETKT